MVDGCGLRVEAPECMGYKGSGIKFSGLQFGAQGVGVRI
jgi:hypothetical protein